AHGTPGFGRRLDRAGLAKRIHIIDEASAGGSGLAHDFGLAGIDREQRATAGECFDHGDDAADLFIHRHGLRARPGGTTPENEDGRALLDQPAAVLDGLAGIEELPAVGEGIGSDVDDAHDDGLREIEDLVPAVELQKWPAQNESGVQVRDATLLSMTRDNRSVL